MKLPHAQLSPYFHGLTTEQVNKNIAQHQRKPREHFTIHNTPFETLMLKLKTTYPKQKNRSNNWILFRFLEIPVTRAVFDSVWLSFTLGLPVLAVFCLPRKCLVVYANFAHTDFRETK